MQLLAALRIESTGVPIYVQLRDQLQSAIASGRLCSGDQLPTMRQVAVAVKVDLNTVRHAYDELERLGALTLVRGRGSFVAETPPRNTSSPEDRIETLAIQTLGAARDLGLNPITLASRIAALAAPSEELP